MKRLCLILLLLTGFIMFDHLKADKAVRFFQEKLTHTTGDFAGKPFLLFKWQMDIVRKLYGNVDINGYRQYRYVYIEIPKKNGKSELAAGIALKQLLADGEKGAEVYSGAGDREQASIVFNVAEQMVRNNKSLDRRCKIQPSIKQIKVPKTNSKYKVLSSETRTKHGVNSSCVIIDELHVIKRDFYDILTFGAGDARKQPIFFFITTAGEDKTSVCWELHNHALKVIENPGYDPSFLAVIYKVDELENWELEENWLKANPSIPEIISLDTIRAAFKQAKLLPSRETAFRRLRLNQWISSEVKWMNLSLFQECRNEKISFADFKGFDCFIGLDLSSTKDITAVCYTFPDYDRELFYLFWKFYIPKDTVTERVRKDKVPYDVWIREGYITVTEGRVIDYRYIINDINLTVSTFMLNVIEIPYDPWNSVQTALELEGDGYTMVMFRQGFASMSPASKEFEIKTLKRNIQYVYNPVAEWMIDNTVVLTDPADNIKPSKKKSSEKIDGVIAAIISVYRAILNKNSGSIYDKGARG